MTDVLPIQFQTLRLFGLWYESEKPQLLVKYIWRPLIVIVIIVFTILLLGAMAIYRDNVSHFTECLFLSLTYVGLCFKLINMLSRRKAMCQLLRDFRRKICIARDDYEILVLKKYRKISDFMYSIFMIVCQFDGVGFAFAPLVSIAFGHFDVDLPYKSYELYDKSNWLYYWITYVFQVFSIFVGICVNVTFDTLFAGFILVTCAQIDLCCHRITLSSDRGIITRQSIRDFIIHHILIRKIVQKIQSFFMRVIFPLMCLCLITFCTSVYNVSQVKSNVVEAIPFCIYLVCLLYQLGCYCWFGNELKLRSSAVCESIYNINWMILKPKDRKNLFFIMLVCQREMSMSFHGICTINIEMFVWILKTSYTVYNLLKTIE